MAKKNVAEKVLAEGHFAAHESDDNSIDVSNPNYVGVDPEYRNSAFDTEKPSEADSEDSVVQRVKKRDEELSNLKVNRAGYTPGEHRAGRGVKVGDKDATIPDGTNQGRYAE